MSESNISKAIKAIDKEMQEKPAPAPKLRLPPSTEELLAERDKTHGDFSDHARITINLKDCMEHCRGTNWSQLNEIQRESLHMIQHKIGRILAGNPDHRDHWDDIAGYAKLVAERL